MTNFKKFHWEKKIWDLLIEQWMIHQTDLDQALDSQIQMAKQWFELRIWEILVSSWKVKNRQALISLLVRRGIKLRIWEILFLLWKLTEPQYKDIQRKLLINKKNWVSKSVWDIAIDAWYIDAVSLYNLLENAGLSLTDGEKLVQKKIISRENLNFFLEELKINPKYQWKKILDVLLAEWIITQAIYEQYNQINWNEWAFEFI